MMLRLEVIAMLRFVIALVISKPYSEGSKSNEGENREAQNQHFTLEDLHEDSFSSYGQGGSETIVAAAQKEGTPTTTMNATSKTPGHRIGPPRGSRGGSPKIHSPHDNPNRQVVPGSMAVYQ